MAGASGGMGWGWRTAFVLLVLSSVLMSQLTAAQPSQDAPPVELGAPTIEGYVTPVTERRNATFQVRVGCEMLEAPGTRTQVELTVPDEPAGAQIALSRTSLSWRGDPGDCPSGELPFEANVTASVALNWEAPGFQEQTVPIQAVVTKRGDPPLNEPRTYGPYNTTLTFTPGYYHQHTVDLEGIQEAGPDGVATFDVTLVSQANAEGRFRIVAEDLPSWVEVSFQPESLVIPAGESAPIQVTAAQVAPAEGNAQVILLLNTTGAPTHPAGGQGGHYAVGVIVDFSETDLEGGRSAIPGVGAPMLILTLAAVVALGRRSGR